MAVERGPHERFKELRASIFENWVKQAARFAGDRSRWTRRRDMPLEDLILCTLGKKGLTTTMELRQYFQAMGRQEHTVSKQDYLRQRQNLNPRVFTHLNRNYLQHFYQGEEARGWEGYVLLAVDGSRVEIPNSPENRQRYGESQNKYGKAVARANFSGIYDVYNGFFLDIGVYHYRSSEIQEAKAHIPAVRQIVGERPVLIVFDRNYVSLEFIDYLEQMGIKYLMRLHKGDYKAEVAGREGQEAEVEIEHTTIRLRNLRREDPGRAEELAGKGSTRARIVKMEFGDGEEGLLITNLAGYTGEQIQALYRLRWEIEKKYHTLKNKMKFESITGNASVYVEQDFWAQVMVYNMVTDVRMAAQWKLEEEQRDGKKGWKYEMRINENIAIGLFKEQLLRLILEEDEGKKARMFERLQAEMRRNIVPVRKLKGRRRKWNYFNKYKCNQRPSF
jgi:hypothetical protein